VSDVVIVDYGAGNTRSVRAALRHLGRDSVVTTDATLIRESSFVVLPGVGSARSAMEHLNASGAAIALKQRFDDERPILGICLGLQLAMTTLEEDGGVRGLGLVEGDVIRIDDARVPRLGWSVVEPWGDAFYFAHSYAVLTPDAIAGVEGVTVAVRRGPFFGVQFHPEKSGPAGLEFLDQCLSLV
jgi:imidazole glycerol-phosphate synthase subunit HisH